MRALNPTAMLRASVALFRRRETAADIAKAKAAPARMTREAMRRPDALSARVISHERKYIWLCNPKVASRSIIAALRAADPSAEVIRNASLSRIYEIYPEAKDYFTFAFVRHPVTRAYSLYRDVLHGGIDTERSQLPNRRRRPALSPERHGLDEASAFEEFCEWLRAYGPNPFADPRFMSQSAQLRIPDGCLPDFIGRFENLDADFDAVTERLGLPPTPLPLLNTMAARKARHNEGQSDTADLRPCVTPYAEDALRARYAEDFRIGGYAPAVNAIEVWERNGEWRMAGRISTPNSKPVISVVIELSRRTVTGKIPVHESIRNQINRHEQIDMDQVEFIVVGDTAFDAASYGENVISARSPKGGHYERLNAGAALARGEFITFWAGDCKASQGYLTRALNILRDSPEASGVTSITAYDGRNLISELNTIVSFGYLTSLGAARLSASNPAPSHGVVIRKSFFTDRPFGNYSAMYGGDMHLTDYAIRSGAPLMLDPGMKVLHEDMSFSLKALLDRHLREIFSMNEVYYSDHIIRSALIVALKSPRWRYARVKSYAPAFGWKKPRMMASTLVLGLYGALDVCAVLVLAISPSLLRKWIRYQFGE